MDQDQEPEQLFSAIEERAGEERARIRQDAETRARVTLEEAFARARQEIERMGSSPDAAAALEMLSAEASAAVGEPCTVDVDRKKGSVVAVSSDGRRRADNSLLVRLDRAQTAYEAEVAGLLFGRAPK